MTRLTLAGMNLRRLRRLRNLLTVSLLALPTASCSDEPPDDDILLDPDVVVTLPDSRPPPITPLPVPSPQTGVTTAAGAWETVITPPGGGTIVIRPAQSVQPPDVAVTGALPAPAQEWGSLPIRQPTPATPVTGRIAEAVIVGLGPPHCEVPLNWLEWEGPQGEDYGGPVCLNRYGQLEFYQDLANGLWYGFPTTPPN